MGYEHILYDVRDRVATVTLNRPEKLNAWTGVMGREVQEAMTQAAADDAVRVIVLTGAGRGFCAGADMDVLAGIQSGGAAAAAEVARPPAPAGERAEFGGRYAYFPTISKPIIGALNGAPPGSASWWRSTATFGSPPTRRCSRRRSHGAASSLSTASAGCCPAWSGSRTRST